MGFAIFIFSLWINARLSPALSCFLLSWKLIRSWQERGKWLWIRSGHWGHAVNLFFFNGERDWLGWGPGAEREQNSAKMVWLLRNKVRGLEPKFSESLLILKWAALQRNYQVIKWYHITTSNMQNSYVSVGPKGLPPFNWTLYLVSNWVLKNIWVDIWTLQDCLHEILSVIMQVTFWSKCLLTVSFHVHFGAQVIAVRKTHYKLGEKAACSTVT